MRISGNKHKIKKWGKMQKNKRKSNKIQNKKYVVHIWLIKIVDAFQPLEKKSSVTFQPKLAYFILTIAFVMCFCLPFFKYQYTWLF